MTLPQSTTPKLVTDPSAARLAYRARLLETLRNVPRTDQRWLDLWILDRLHVNPKRGTK